MRSIYLLVNMTGIDQQHLIRPFAPSFGLVEEPEGAGQCNSIEEIGGDTHHHEVEPVQTPMWIYVVAVRLSYIAFQSMHGKVHLTEPNRLRDLFRSVNADLIVSILPVVMNKLCTLDKHTARAARWVQNPSFKRLENLDNQFYQRGGCEEFAAPSAIAKLPQKYS